MVVLSSEFYKHKTYGRIYNPIITIAKWVGLDDAVTPAEKVETVEQDEPKKRTRRRAV